VRLKSRPKTFVMHTLNENGGRGGIPKKNTQLA
jgi:hypothetical protein